MKNKIMILIISLLIPLIGYAAWMSKITNSNGTTVVTIVDAPAASTTRIVAANGGVTAYNSSGASVTFDIQLGNTLVTNVIEKVILGANDTYINDWSLALDGTTNTLEFVGSTAFGTVVDIITRYSDQGQ